MDKRDMICPVVVSLKAEFSSRNDFLYSKPETAILHRSKKIPYKDVEFFSRLDTATRAIRLRGDSMQKMGRKTDFC